MFPKNGSIRCVAASVLAVVIALVSSASTTAAVVTLDFEGVVPNAGNGTAYLNSNGITLKNVTPSGPAGVVDICNFSGPGSAGLMIISFIKVGPARSRAHTR